MNSFNSLHTISPVDPLGVLPGNSSYLRPFPPSRSISQPIEISSWLRALVAAAALLSLAACEPDLDQRLSLLDEPRVLAVISEPAETAPQTQATHRVHLASKDGAVITSVAWAFCTEPKPPTEDNVVNARCLGDAVRELGHSEAITALTPVDACMRFGPDVTSGEYRPRSPDLTGGYYQPLRLTPPAELNAAVAFASHRISCNLANAPVDVVRQYRERYVANQNPAPPALVRADGASLTARPGDLVDLLASWPAGAAEPYVSYEQATARLLDRREGLRLSWYATAGQWCSDATGQSEEELAADVAPGEQAPAGESPNCWRAPDEPGPVTMWIVLRDSRGGAAIHQQTIEVTP
jgi:hypothetical protein